MRSRPSQGPCELLRALRAKGHRVRVDGGELVVCGPKPPKVEAARKLIRENKTALIEVLEAEQHPSVRDAIEVLGARLVAVRRTGGTS